MAPVTAMATPTAPPAAAPVTAVVDLNGGASYLALHGGRAGNYRSSLNGKTEKGAKCDYDREYILAHE